MLMEIYTCVSKIVFDFHVCVSLKNEAKIMSINWQMIPKVLLHEHLDGGLRPQTLLELCRARNLPTPANTAPDLASWVQANANSGSLVRYLQGFGLTVGAMASVAACERVAYEACEDARLDGCVLAEFRIAPLLLEEFGLAGEAVVEALLRGMEKSTLVAGLIVCGMRHEPAANTLRSAQLAARYADAGVVGFDLAGAEHGFPPSLHARAIAVARDAGLGITLHAGEADSGARVIEAAALGATRIGHGVNIMASADGHTHRAWVDDARARGLHFEVCPTSNVHTGAAASIATHPLRAMVEAGLSVSVSTDNRLMSGITMSEEFRNVHTENGISLSALRAMMEAGANASFLPKPKRDAALAALRAVHI